MIRTFFLNKQAYHYLDNNLSVVITETGFFSTLRNKKSRYVIRLNEPGTQWVYCKLDETQNFYGEKYLTLNWRFCRVYMGYEGVPRYNKK
jgi:hypothetical protein